MRILSALAVLAASALSLAAQPASANDRYGPFTEGQGATYLRADSAGDGQVIQVTKRRRYVQPQYVPEPGVYYYDNGGSLKDDPGAYYPPEYTGDYPEIYDQAAAPPPVFGPSTQCLTAVQVQRNLVRQGWRDFSGPQKGVDVVGVTARRPNGLTYRLKLDRCTGVIISANLLDQADRRRTFTYTPPAEVPGY